MNKSLIDKYYIDKAISIRKEYLKCIDNINIDIEKIQNFKEKIQDILENGDEHLNKFKNSSEEIYMKEMMIIVEDIKKCILDVQKDIIPYQEKMKNLEKESDMLYISITEKYPDLTTEEIKEQIYNSIPEKLR